MYPLYKDIRERLGEPLWHDQDGVPRYAEFNPQLLGIYDDWACLFVVECQSCSRQFKCAAGLSVVHYCMKNYLHDKSKWDEMTGKRDDAEFVLPHLIGWGDAPWHDDERQCAGTTMSTDVVAILEVWHRKNSEWKRVTISHELANSLLGFEVNA